MSVDDASKKMTVPEALRELRKAKNMSQETFARWLDVSLRTVTRFEAGLQPSASWLLTLAGFARAQKREDLAAVFAGALIDDFGFRDHGPLLSCEDNYQNGFAMTSFEGKVPFEILAAAFCLLDLYNVSQTQVGARYRDAVTRLYKPVYEESMRLRESLYSELVAPEAQTKNKKRKKDS